MLENKPHSNPIYSQQIISLYALVLTQCNRFDAWGRPRNPGDWLYDDTTYSELPFDMGFTGHEHYERFDLINMNGRTYDPVLGRFLSPDPYTQFPENTQNYNRYSYGLNNPLRFTDPSGYNLWDKIEKGLDWGARMFLNRITIPGRVFSGMVGYTNDQINDNESQFGYFNAEYILYGATSMKDIEWSNFLAAAKNNIKHGRNPFGNMQDNFAMYDRLHEQYVRDYYQNQLTKAKMRFAAFSSSEQIEKVMKGGSLSKNITTLLMFSKECFPKYIFRNQVNNIYDDEVVEEKGEEDAEALTKLEPYSSALEPNDSYNIYYSSDAFSSPLNLFQAMGHEYIHVAHRILMGSDYNGDFSEYSAYRWNNMINQNADYDKRALKKFNPEASPLHNRIYQNIIEPDYLNWKEYGLPSSIPF